MPELPEVETVRRVIEPYFLNNTIEKIDIKMSKILKTHNGNQFKKLTNNVKVIKVGRHAKHLFLHLSNEWVLILHLRMTGKFRVLHQKNKNIDKKESKYDMLVFKMNKGPDLAFNDFRQFATAHLVLESKMWDLEPLSNCGPEVYQTNWKVLKEKISHRSMAIKTLLLDQSIMSGLGNIYVDETLWACHLHPESKPQRLKDDDYKCLIKQSRVIMTKAIKYNGTTKSTFTPIVEDTNFKIKGDFQKFLKIHTKNGEQCECGNSEIYKKYVGGRGTYYCPKCQKKK